MLEAYHTKNRISLRKHSIVQNPLEVKSVLSEILFAFYLHIFLRLFFLLVHNCILNNMTLFYLLILFNRNGLSVELTHLYQSRYKNGTGKGREIMTEIGFPLSFSSVGGRCSLSVNYMLRLG